MIIIDEYKVKLKQIKAEIDDLYGAMGIENERKRLSEIEDIFSRFCVGKYYICRKSSKRESRTQAIALDKVWGM